MPTTATTSTYQFPYPLNTDSLSLVAQRIKELADRCEAVNTLYGLGVTQSTSDSSTKVASTAFVQAFAAAIVAGQIPAGTITNAAISNTAAIASSKLDLSTYAGHTVVANAAARPASPVNGQMIYQTDTDEVLKYVTDLDGTPRWMVADHDYNRNFIVNGAFEIAQRGTTFTSAIASPYYGLDRWQFIQSNAGGTFTRTATTTTDPAGYNFYLRVQRTAAATITSVFQVQSSLESLNVKRLQGKYVTVSFWARAGANYSASSSFLVSRLITGTGTDGNLATGFTTQANNVTANNILTTSWKRYTMTTTAALASTVTQLGVQFEFTPTGTAGAADYFDITGVQVEGYSAVSDFEFREPGDELRRCQRYYFRVTADATNNTKHFGMGFANSATVAEIMIPFPAVMRTAAALDNSASLRVSDNTTNTNVTSVAMISAAQSEYQAVVNCTVASGLTAFRPMVLQSAASGSGYIGFTAEL